MSNGSHSTSVWKQKVSPVCKSLEKVYYSVIWCACIFVMAQHVDKVLPGIILSVAFLYKPRWLTLYMLPTHHAHTNQPITYYCCIVMYILCDVLIIMQSYSYVLYSWLQMLWIAITQNIQVIRFLSTVTPIYIRPSCIQMQPLSLSITHLNSVYSGKLLNYTNIGMSNIWKHDYTTWCLCRFAIFKDYISICM